MAEQLLTVQEVCERLHVSRANVYRLLKSGDLRAVKVGRCTRFRAEALDEWVRARETAETAR